jgi:hypothetical protein
MNECHFLLILRSKINKKWHSFKTFFGGASRQRSFETGSRGF